MIIELCSRNFAASANKMFVKNRGLSLDIDTKFMRMMHRMREMGDGIVTLEIWKRYCNAV